MARITLEELNELDDEIPDEEEEPMDGEETNRLFSHWETVASTHQVTLPQGKKSFPSSKAGSVSKSKVSN